ncbi:MAG: DUF1150 family protein [Pseudomonadota bacterium]
MNDVKNNPGSDADIRSAIAEGFAAVDPKKLVYIRPIAASDVMDDLEDALGDIDSAIEGDAILYSVHDADGERLALVGDRELAFAAARQYEMTPVSVH